MPRFFPNLLALVSGRRAAHDRSNEAVASQAKELDVMGSPPRAVSYSPSVSPDLGPPMVRHGTPRGESDAVPGSAQANRILPADFIPRPRFGNSCRCSLHRKVR